MLQQSPFKQLISALSEISSTFRLSTASPLLFLLDILAISSNKDATMITEAIRRVNGYDKNAYTYYPVIIVGAGASGIAMACQLKEQLGFDQFRVFERQTGIGGTWWINRYPGVAWYVYIPLKLVQLPKRPSAMLCGFDAQRSAIHHGMNPLADNTQRRARRFLLLLLCAKSKLDFFPPSW